MEKMKTKCNKYYTQNRDASAEILKLAACMETMKTKNREYCEQKQQENAQKNQNDAKEILELKAELYDMRQRKKCCGIQ